jgi:hypothetical protein
MCWIVRDRSDPGPWRHDPGSMGLGPRILDPGVRTQDPENHGSRTPAPWSWILDPGPGPGSRVLDPGWAQVQNGPLEATWKDSRDPFIISFKNIT